MKKIKYEMAKLSMEPQNTVKLEGKDAETMLKLMELLEDHDDIQNAYANFDIEITEMEKIAAGAA